VIGTGTRFKLPRNIRPRGSLAHSRTRGRARLSFDFEDDQSLVLIETDYFDRLSFDTPLDVEFRSDAASSGTRSISPEEGLLSFLERLAADVRQQATAKE
jgi:hypothetical protein